jgi:hypothetical protein
MADKRDLRGYLRPHEDRAGGIGLPVGIRAISDVMAVSRGGLACIRVGETDNDDQRREQKVHGAEDVRTRGLSGGGGGCHEGCCERPQVRDFNSRANLVESREQSK